MGRFLLHKFAVWVDNNNVTPLDSYFSVLSRTQIKFNFGSIILNIIVRFSLNGNKTNFEFHNLTVSPYSSPTNLPAQNISTPLLSSQRKFKPKKIWYTIFQSQELSSPTTF